VVAVVREVVCGAEAEVFSWVIGTQRSVRALINTAYIERCTLDAGMWLVGGCYNFVRMHRSLGEGRSPAMAAGLTDHRWSMEELLRYPVPPAELPRWRGRKPRWLLEAERAA
jgi:hypothetical protein